MKKRFSEERIITILGEQESGFAVKEKRTATMEIEDDDPRETQIQQ